VGIAESRFPKEFEEIYSKMFKLDHKSEEAYQLYL